jgi:hypothetical protein
VTPRKTWLLWSAVVAVAVYVLAGWSLGYAYFVACLLMVPPTGTVTAADETPAAPGIAR